MTRDEAWRALCDAVRIADANRGDREIWAAQWERMGQVQRAYDGALSLEPLLMLRPPPEPEPEPEP